MWPTDSLRRRRTRLRAVALVLFVLASVSLTSIVHTTWSSAASDAQDMAYGLLNGQRKGALDTKGQRPSYQQSVNPATGRKAVVDAQTGFLVPPPASLCDSNSASSSAGRPGSSASGSRTAESNSPLLHISNMTACSSIIRRKAIALYPEEELRGIRPVPPTRLQRGLHWTDPLTDAALPGYVPSMAGSCLRGDLTCVLEWVTFVSDCDAAQSRFVQSILAKGIPLTVLGLGSSWDHEQGRQIRALHDYLTTVPPERLIIWSSSRNTIVTPTSSVQEILRAYRTLVYDRQGPLVFFAAQKDGSFDSQIRHKYPRPIWVKDSPGPSDFQYMSAGTLFGSAGHIAALLRSIYTSDCMDVQHALTHAFLDPLMWWRDSTTGMYTYATSNLTARHVSSPTDPSHSSTTTNVHVDASLDSLSTHDAPAIPKTALPLVGLDYWNQMTAALISVNINEITADAVDGSVLINQTGGKPLILYTDGTPTSNLILENITHTLYCNPEHLDSIFRNICPNAMTNSI